MQEIRRQRLQYEAENLIENADQLPPNCSYRRTDSTHYVLQYVGQKGTPHEGAYIICDLDLTNYPDGHPVVQFRNEFQHVNVYPLGRLCLYLINQETFTCGTTLLEIFIGINEVIHHPTFHDPANNQVVLAVGGKGYDDKMRDQAARLSNPKYKAI